MAASWSNPDLASGRPPALHDGRRTRQHAERADTGRRRPPTSDPASETRGVPRLLDVEERRRLRRVLALNVADAVGGAEVYLRDLCLSLEMSDVRTLTLVVGERQELCEELSHSGLSVQHLTSAVRFRNLASVIRLARTVRACIRAEQPDILLCNLPRGIILGWLACWRTPCERVAVLHSPRGHEPLARLATRVLPRYLICNTLRTARSFTAIRRTAVLLPIVAIDPVPSVGVRKGDGIDSRSRSPDIVMLGRLQPYKGHLDFIAIADAFEKAKRAERFMILGSTAGSDPAYVWQVKALVAARENVELALDRPGAAVRELLRKARVFVHPAHQEDFGIAILEALANGRPVVCYASDGPQIIFKESGGAVLVPIGDVVEIERAVRQVLDDPQCWYRLSVDASATARRFALTPAYSQEVVRALTAALE